MGREVGDGGRGFRGLWRNTTIATYAQSRFARGLYEKHSYNALPAQRTLYRAEVTHTLTRTMTRNTVAAAAPSERKQLLLYGSDAASRGRPSGRTGREGRERYVCVCVCVFLERGEGKSARSAATCRRSFRVILSSS